VPFAPLAADTVATLEARLEPGLVATNPLDVWGTGADSEALFTDCLDALARDPSVDVVALAVDLVSEYDGDTAMIAAVESVIERTDKPVLLLTNLPSAVDQAAAGRLRARGVPVLEGTRSGLCAIGHLLAHAAPPRPARAGPVDAARRARWVRRLEREPFPHSLDLVADYGIPVVGQRLASTCAEAVGAAAELGYPVVLKTAAGLAHKLDVDGVRLDLPDAGGVRTAYEDLAQRLGCDVIVQPYVPPGIEIALGIVGDPLLGPLLLVASGGSLVELLSQRSVALPPVDRPTAEAMIDRLPSSQLLRGHRGRPPGDLDAAVDALLAMSQLAGELGDHIEALDVNPLIVSPTGAIAVDALVTPRRSPKSQPT
jgi:acyl-CoA synthetase (NDP forming)